jgi:hypothetical protein
MQLDNGRHASLHWVLWAINAPSFSKHHKSVSESQLQTYHNDIQALHVPLVASKKIINFPAHDLMLGQLMLLHFQSLILKSQIQANLLFRT